MWFLLRTRPAVLQSAKREAHGEKFHEPFGRLFTVIIVLNGTVASAGEWIADTRTYCLVWNENPQSDQRVLWSGNCPVADIAEGPGVVQWILNGQ